MQTEDYNQTLYNLIIMVIQSKFKKQDEIDYCFEMSDPLTLYPSSLSRPTFPPSPTHIAAPTIHIFFTNLPSRCCRLNRVSQQYFLEISDSRDAIVALPSWAIQFAVQFLPFLRFKCLLDLNRYGIWNSKISFFFCCCLSYIFTSTFCCIILFFFQ